MAVPAEYMYFPLNESAFARFAIDQSAIPKLTLTKRDFISGPSSYTKRLSGSFGVQGKLRTETCFYNSDAVSSSMFETFETSPTNITPLRTIRPEATVSLWASIGDYSQVEYQTGTFGSRRIFQIYWELSSNKYSTELLVFDNPNRIVARFVNGNQNWKDVIFVPNSYPINRWLHITFSWKENGTGKLYINGVLIGTSPFIPPTTAEDYTMSMSLCDQSPGGLIQNKTYVGKLQDVRFWDSQLSDAVVLEHFNEVQFEEVLTSKSTIPKRELKLMRQDITRTLPHRCTIQEDNIESWNNIYTNVPCSIELTGTTNEKIDTLGVAKIADPVLGGVLFKGVKPDDAFISIQNWVVTIPGNYRLPNPKAYGDIRFIVNQLELRSYKYYQSPDDIQTVIECKNI